MCGNFGLLALAGVDEETIQAILREMAALTELRGALGGGLATLSWQYGSASDGEPTVVKSKRVRVLQGKRQTLTDELLKSNAAERPQIVPGKDSVVAYVGHTRYPTSSRSTIPELHPHVWTPHEIFAGGQKTGGGLPTNSGNCGLMKEEFPHPGLFFSPCASGAGAEELLPHEGAAGYCAPLTRAGPGLPTVKGKDSSSLRSGIFLSHNGDFEKYDLFDSRVTCTQVGEWLSRVLRAPNSLQGDSPKIAGMMELLHVKGNWFAAVRLAYQMTVASSIYAAFDEDVSCSSDAPNTSPPNEWYAAVGKLLAEEWEACVAQQQHTAGDGDGFDSLDLADFAVHVVRKAATDDRWLGLLVEQVHGGESQYERLMRYAVEKFLEADLFQSLSEFLTNAHGSFGIQVVSSTDPGCLVVGAKGQSMHVSFDIDAGVALSASEGRAVDASSMKKKAGSPGDGDGGGGGGGGGRGKGGRGKHVPSSAGRFKMRLATETGQVVELRSLKSRGGDSPAGFPSVRAFGDTGGCVGWPGRFAVRAYDLILAAEMLPSDLISAIEPAVHMPRQPAPSTSVAENGSRLSDDEVLEDLRDIPAVMSTISEHWRGSESKRNGGRDDSYNVSTAKAFSEALRRSKAVEERASDGNTATPHLLVLGIEVSLFIAEQFAADVGACVPGLRANALSANKFLGGEAVLFGSYTAKASSVEALAVASTTVLVVSHSGQTYPCLKATKRLVDALGGENVFILVGGGQGITGGEDSAGEAVDAEHTEMGSILMEYHKQNVSSDGTSGSDHIFCNLSGFRPAEPSSVALVAAHHTLTELCIFLTKPLDESLLLGGNEAGAGAGAGGDRESLLHSEDLAYANASGAAGARKTRAEKKVAQFHKDVVGLVEPSIKNMERIVGRDSLDRRLRTEAWQVDVALGRRRRQHSGGGGGTEARYLPLSKIPGAHAALVRLGRRWGHHLSEGWRTLFLVGVYIVVSVLCQVPVWRSLLNAFVLVAGGDDEGCFDSFTVWDVTGGLLRDDCDGFAKLMSVLVPLLDGITYVLTPVFFARLLRWFEGRPLYHRFGKRTLVIADNPFVARCAEAFGTRLYALSYGFSGIEIHTADPCDDLIHRFGYRASRGMLVLAGRPDGRLFSLTRTEVAGIMGIKQLRFVESLNEGPEVITTGANPFHEQTLVHAHIALPQSSAAKRITTFSEEPSRKPAALMRKDSMIDGMAFTKGQTHNLRPSTNFFWSRENSAKSDRSSRGSKDHFPGTNRSSRGSRKFGKNELDPKSSRKSVALLSRHSGEGVNSPLRGRRESFSGGISQSSDDVDNPLEIEAFQSRHNEVDISKYRRVQQFLESRFASVERFVSAAVLLHAMAEGTQANLWGLPRWDMSRSQAHLRVATTACPVTDEITEVEKNVVGRAEIAHY
jgi:hypothetical protein